MRILITGGAGFIGSHLVERLLPQAHDLLVIDNFATGRRDNLPIHPQLRLVEGHIADEALMSEIFQSFQPEVVVHAAVSYKDPDDFVEDARTNVLGTAVLVKQAQAHGVQRLIYFQTALCYGVPQTIPVPLDHPIAPNPTSYATSKTAAEWIINLGNLNTWTFRLANVYGPRNISGPLPTFYHRLSQNKPCFVVDSRRDFVYVDDVVDIVAMAVEGHGEPGVYHISSGQDISIKDLFDAVVDAMGITLSEPIEVRPRTAEDVPTILLDPSKTLAVFGKIPETPLSVGIPKTLAYYREFGITETYTHLNPKKLQVAGV